MTILEATTEIVKAAMASTTGAYRNPQDVSIFIETVYAKLTDLELTKPEDLIKVVK